MRLRESEKEGLKYLVDSTIQLIVMMILTGMIYGYVKNAFARKYTRFILICIGTGLAGSVVMAVMKTATNKIDTGMWNLWFYFISGGAFILFLIFTLAGKFVKKIASLLPCICLGIIVIIQMVYALADYLVYPHTMMLTEDSVISTTFITKLTGMLLGTILVLVAGIAVYKGSLYLKQGEITALLIAAALVNGFKQVATAFSVLLARRIIPSNHTLFVLAKFATNNTDLFIYILLGISLLIAVILLIRRARADEPYSNPAERRKIKFRWILIKRWSVTIIVCSVLAVIIMTAIDALANQEIELSPVEEAVVQDGNVYVSFEQVSDGHLHRFGYETEKGTVIRFIVIKKPNSSAYGIGLDACDICGETGYYEKNGQVVCNLCDVVMNINTIGFKGGCNPIVIDYSIENGHIVVPIDGLLEYEDEFNR